MRRFAKALSAAVCVLWCLGASGAQAGGPTMEVDLELVLAVDVSGSIDPYEARQQREGYIAALESKEVQEAIASGILGRIALTYVEWGGERFQATMVPWHLIDGPDAMAAFVEDLGVVPYRTVYWTSISAAVDYSVRQFDGNGYDGLRRVIDISGDGPNNRGRPAADARDDAVAQGIVINGLPILNDRPNPYGIPAMADLDRYFRENVIGGPGAFLEVAETFESFPKAVLRKLVREIAARPAPRSPDDGPDGVAPEREFAYVSGRRTAPRAPAGMPQ